MSVVPIRCVVAPNPGPLTGNGTNSYLIGKGEVLLVDPGPDLPAHQAEILATLAPGEHIAAILITHSHLDHTALARQIADATHAPVLGAGPAGSGRSALMARLAADGLQGGGEGFDQAYAPDRVLQGDERLRFGGIEIEVLRTPGHTGCHLAFACAGHLFSGDTVMGWSTSVVSPPDGDMGDYMKTLSDLSGRAWDAIHPGHGPTIDTPALRLAELIAHRRSREASILSALAIASATPMDLAERLYVDTPKPLLPAAARNVLAHLLDLQDRGIVRMQGTPDMRTEFQLR